MNGFTMNRTGFLFVKANGYIQSMCCYHPLPFTKKLKYRIEQHQNPSLKQQLKTNRKIWARIGSASNVDPGSLFPSVQEMSEEISAEKRWWPSLQDMQKKIERQKCKTERKKAERQKKIDINMSKMPKWIAEYEKQLKDTEEAKKTSAEKAMWKSLHYDKLKFKFAQTPAHPQLTKIFERPKKSRPSTQKNKKK